MFITLLLALQGCTRDKGSDTDASASVSAETYLGTQSPGDVWRWTIDEDAATFSVVWDVGTAAAGDDVTLSGGVAFLGSGFRQLTVTASSSSAIPTDGSAFFYAIAVPDVLFLAKPEGSIKDDLIFSAAYGPCADAFGTYNYLLAAPPSETYAPLTEEAYGELVLGGTTDAVAVSGHKYSLDCLSGACTVDAPLNPPPDGTCTGDELAISGATGSVSAAGALVLDWGMGSGGAVGFRQDASITLAALRAQTYKGAVYFPADDDSAPVYLSFTGDTEAEALPILDLETGTTDAAEAMAFAFSETVTDGRVTGEAIHGDGTRTPMVGAALVQPEGTALYLVSVRTPDADPFVILLVSR